MTPTQQIIHTTTSTSIISPHINVNFTNSTTTVQNFDEQVQPNHPELSIDEYQETSSSESNPISAEPQEELICEYLPVPEHSNIGTRPIARNFSECSTFAQTWSDDDMSDLMNRSLNVNSPEIEPPSVDSNPPSPIVENQQPRLGSYENEMSQQELRDTAKMGRKPMFVDSIVRDESRRLQFGEK